MEEEDLQKVEETVCLSVSSLHPAKSVGGARVQGAADDVAAL